MSNNIKEYVVNELVSHLNRDKSERLKTPFRLFIHCYPDYDIEWCSPEIFYDVNSKIFNIREQKVDGGDYDPDDNRSSLLIEFKNMNILLEDLWIRFISKLQFAKLEDDDARTDINFIKLCIYYGYTEDYPNYPHIVEGNSLQKVRSYPTLHTVDEDEIKSIFKDAINYMIFLLKNDAIKP